jgi:prolyl oligopeptidase PreP (S9A serine peptidase family)
MVRLTGLRRIALAVASAALLVGCAGVRVGQPTPVAGSGPYGRPQPTATQIAVGANPAPATPQVDQFVANLRPRAGRGGEDTYAWLQNVHSSKTRHWIRAEDRAARKALAAIPERAWLRRRVEALERGESRGIPGDIEVRHVRYLGPDGVPMPMQIAYRRGLIRDGDRPTLLSVYHATGKPPVALLRPLVLAWLEMGGVYARAQVRNGLAKIPAARAAGKVPDRSIALSDLFAAAQSLIDERYTRRARLGIYGRGFGGLMAGAAVALRPDFFGAALPTGTWAQYRRITSGNCYPPTLITTAQQDGDLRPWRGYELAAVLQAEQLCRHPILIRIDRDEAQAGRAARARARAADELAFAAKWLGARPPAPTH